MPSLLAQDLLLLAWDDERGAPSRGVSSTLPAGLGGALILDALLEGLVIVEDDRVTTTGTAPQDELSAAVVEEVDRRRRAPKVTSLVQRLGTSRRVREVRDRLVREGVLREERQRRLGPWSTTRFHPTDPTPGQEMRTRVRDLLVGAVDPNEVDDRLVMLAALAGSTSLVDRLVDRSDRKQARKRAEAFGEGDGVSPAVRDAIAAAQAATVAAVAAASAATSGSSN